MQMFLDGMDLPHMARALCGHSALLDLGPPLKRSPGGKALRTSCTC